MKNTTYITCWDIETKPNIEMALTIAGKFNPDKVKCGNLGAEKAEQKIEAARASHESDAIGKAALDPMTSTIVAIGYHDQYAVSPILIGGDGWDETEILADFWIRANDMGTDKMAFYTGSNNKGAFDLRHIIVRSWANRVNVPERFVRPGWALPEPFIDMAQRFLVYSDSGSYCGLNKACKALGLIGADVGFATIVDGDDLASDGVQGKHFWKLWESSEPADRALAERYLINDLAQTRGIANCIMGGSN